jgi:Helix-turn-helix domain
VFELGNSLREARQRQAIDYSQAELATKIRAKYLRALEDEAFEILPSETYVKGFLRSYADYLGLDGQLYVDEYNSRYGGERHDDVPRRTRIDTDRGLERKVVLVALAGIAVVTALVIVAWKFGAGDTTQGTPPVTTQGTTTRSSLHALELRGVGRGTYVEIHRATATGRLLLAATVARGDVQRIAGDRFWLFIRRPAGLEVALNGKPVSLPPAKQLCVAVSPKRTSRTGC